MDNNTRTEAIDHLAIAALKMLRVRRITALRVARDEITDALFELWRLRQKLKITDQEIIQAIGASYDDLLEWKSIGEK